MWTRIDRVVSVRITGCARTELAFRPRPERGKVRSHDLEVQLCCSKGLVKPWYTHNYPVGLSDFIFALIIETLCSTQTPKEKLAEKLEESTVQQEEVNTPHTPLYRSVVASRRVQEEVNAPRSAPPIGSGSR